MSGAAAPRQATGMTGDALAASNAWDAAASRQDALVSERSGLLDLAERELKRAQRIVVRRVRPVTGGAS